jgi:pentatricopeptide repeat protein
LEWFINASRITRPRLKVLYNLDGRPIRTERELLDVDGYAGARPVRIGNAAARQHQLDVYGWVIDAAWLVHASGNELNAMQWRAIRSFADLIAKKWRLPDHGIWEDRDAPRQYVHSKLMAWLGLDRAIRLARSHPAGRRARVWQTQRDLLEREIRTRGCNAQRRTYVRTFDSNDLDASVLILPTLGFEQDPRTLHATIDAVRRELGVGGPLLYRFRHETGSSEGAFLPCSFWLVQALARTGRVGEAEELFDELCAMSTPLGLYGEQIDPATKTIVGNFPQAFSHATFLQAAAALNEARGTSQGSNHRVRALPD